MRRRTELVILTLLAFYWLAPILPIPQPKTPISRLHLLGDPTAVYASRVYNGSTDDSTFPMPNLSSYKKVAVTYWIKASSWGGNNFTNVPDATFGTVDGAFRDLPNSSFFNSGSGCNVTNQWFLQWDDHSANGKVVWFPRPSTNAWHRIVEIFSVPGVSGNGTGGGGFMVYIDGAAAFAPSEGPGGTCPNFAHPQATLNSSGFTAHLSDKSQGGSIADFAIYASTDNTQGSLAGFNGAGLPTGSCTGTPCTSKGDVSALQFFPANSHCISAVPLVYVPMWGVDSPEPSAGVVGPTPLTLTGTTAAGAPLGLQPCTLD